MLARFRPEPAVLRELDEIELEPGERDDGPLPGQLPRSWLAGRAVASAFVEGPFAAVGKARSLAYLRDRLADRALHHGVDEIDAAAIRVHAPRAFTQEVSRLVFECADSAGEPQFHGIAYRSRLGDEVANWAIFEAPGGQARLNETQSEPVNPDDLDLGAALELLGIGSPSQARRTTSRRSGTVAGECSPRWALAWAYERGPRAPCRAALVS